MCNTVKMIKIIFISSLVAIVAACSSGGSGTTEGLNLTGRWEGTVNETADVAFDVVVDISQENSVGLTGGPSTSQITFSITFLRTSDPTGFISPCVGTVAGETATITFNSDVPILTGDGFSAQANNSEIVGSIVVDCADESDQDATGGPLRLRRA